MQEQCLEVWVFCSRSLGRHVNAVEKDLRSHRDMMEFDVTVSTRPTRHCLHQGAEREMRFEDNRPDVARV